MKMFVYRYCLTRGILELEGCIVGSSLFRHDSGRYTLPHYYEIGKDCHPTREEAVAAAEAMREKKIASLRKQIAKLEKLTF